jgi:hypothetical protein
MGAVDHFILEIDSDIPFIAHLIINDLAELADPVRELGQGEFQRLGEFCGDGGVDQGPGQANGVDQRDRQAGTVRRLNKRIMTVYRQPKTMISRDYPARPRRNSGCVFIFFKLRN